MQDFRDVLAFHEKFGLPVGKVPTPMGDEALGFRTGFLHEETGEFQDAWSEGDLVKAVDGLLDYVYVVYGTALFLGCPRTIEVRGYGLGLLYWPDFDQVESTAQAFDLVKEGPPRLLPEFLQSVMYHALRTRNEQFARAHWAFRKGEEEAGMVTLNCLRQAATTAYSIAAMMRVPWRLCWRHVQEANMAKRRAASDGSDSKRGTPWDVVKPAGWKAPDSMILVELELAGWKAPKDVIINYATGRVSYDDKGEAT